MPNINGKKKDRDNLQTGHTAIIELSDRISETLSTITPQEMMDNEPANVEPKPKSLAFWLTFAALCLTGLLGALEATVTSTALPTIASALGSGELFIWVINGYYLTSTAFLPTFGQIADIYGRRWPMIIATAVFTFGSGIAGGSNSINMLVAGRLVQGIGAGAINVLIEILICDIVPMRERGKYLGILFSAVGMGSAAGPIFGGLIVQYSSWRWVFYLNLPLGGIATVVLFFFLKVRSDSSKNTAPKMMRIDWIGNLLFVLSMTSILIALSWAGSKYAWSSTSVIVPLVLGILGGIVFVVYQGSSYCQNPTMPLHLFSNRTSATGFALTFFHTLSGIPALYFLPVYFQAILNSTPARAGVQLLPTVLGILPGAIVSGLVLTKFGRYKPIQFVGFAFMTIGFGVLLLLKVDPRPDQWIGYQLISAIGTGLVLPVLLPAIQASLSESDVALSTSTWAFIRSFGMIWGVTIPTAAFINRFNQLLDHITDPKVAALLAAGRSYQSATRTFMETIVNPVTRDQVHGVYVDALKLVWYVSIVFAGVGFLLVFLMKEIPLRKELDTQFGIEERVKAGIVDQPISEMRSESEKV